MKLVGVKHFHWSKLNIKSKYTILHERYKLLLGHLNLKIRRQMKNE